jgi:hypothetical protein
LSAGSATATLTALDCVAPPLDTGSTFQLDTQALNVIVGTQATTQVGGTQATPQFTGPYDGSNTQTSGTTRLSVSASAGPGLPPPMTSALVTLDADLPEILPALGFAAAGADLTPLNLTCGVPVLVPSTP